MLGSPLISIIIPSHNYGRYLTECFTNLQRQTYTNWECLLVDNNSTDNTKQIVLDFSKQEARVKYLFNEVSGPSPSRNLGIKEAKGEYIQFLDADDLLQTDKFKNALAIFNRETDADIVYSGSRYFIDGNKNELFFAMSTDKNSDRDWMPYCEGRKSQMLPYLLKENIMVISSPLTKAAALKEIGYFDETLAFNEDWELWLRFAFSDKKFVFDKTDNGMALIRVHKTSHSRNPFKMFLAGLVIGLRYEDSIKDERLKLTFKKKTAIVIYELERLLFQNLNKSDFFISSVSDLEKVYPDEKYRNWKILFEKKQFLTLKLQMRLSLIMARIKNKF